MDVLYAGFGGFWSCLTSGDISVLQKGQFQFSFFFSVRISQMLQLSQRSSKVQLYNLILFCFSFIPQTSLGHNLGYPKVGTDDLSRPARPYTVNTS